ncbi:Na+/H+ antiporter subunit E [Desulfonema magnum]|uniref:Na+/H+ ion antiporter subunit E domain-containing protein n=1 Tax=Desulfonema magnum TaxID=45655 RepID=A0A975GMW4_9BACT|nr:Na+/H+ antiporter subunit E [Desulfonema magnum]QTA86248.1 Na+/H+ ion antiporter subunit E domain-containing protein [Desulfonema magnum]
MAVTEQENYHQGQPHSSDMKLASPRQKRFSASFFITFFIMFGLWLVLSGRPDLFHISLGIISCFIVSFFSADLLLPSPQLKKMPGLWFRFIRYIPWLLYQVFIANIHVMYLVFHPRMMDVIDPRIMKFKSRLTSDMSLVTLANSITLTPGTITVYISIYGDVTFHVIDIESGKTLPWIMEARIAEVFDE